MRIFLFLCLLLGCLNIECNDNLNHSHIILKGFLGKEELIQARQALSAFQKEKDQTLILEINSTSGDLEQVLELAKTIYELKVLQQLRVIVYLNDNVVGPAALLPFVADERYSSLFISWGDIPLGSEKTIPTNLLRNRVGSLIDNRDPQAPLLHVLADAMSDPNLQVIDDKGWKLIRDNKDIEHPLISAPGQTLVVNQNQLKQLGLVKGVIPLEQFDTLYHLDRQKIKSTDQEEKNVSIVTSSQPSVEERLKKHILFHEQGPNLIGYIYVGDHETAISESTWLYIKQALEYYKKNRPIFIILELNTPGGEVFAAQKISDALKEMDTQFNIPVVSFINNWAISAGAMLAYSTRFITATKDASMGAAEPVYAGESGKMETASEKVNSALRADFANRARFFDRNPLLAEAMVDKDMILVLRHGRVVKLDNENQIRSTGLEPDIILSAKGKLLTLDANQMMQYGVADLMLEPEKLSSITKEEKQAGQWSLEKTDLFQVPFFAEIPQATVDAYRMDWKTQFFVWLATPLISSILFMGLIIGIYMEVSNPGLSLPGSIAAICLFLIVLSSFSLEIANWLELILLLTGLILLLVELFVLPTFGLLGFVGLILFIVGLFGMMLPGFSSIRFEYDSKTLNAAGQYFMHRLAWLSGAFILSIGVIAFLARYITPNFAGFKRFVLAGHEQDASEGFFAGQNPKDLPKPGMEGEVLATLRPSGKIIIQNQIYEALSYGGFIEAGEKIVILRLEGSVIIVKPAEESSSL